ncbi:thymidylate synthase [Fluviispira multicolorata]|nr:thymidylate synthase [Fluviispira multicolorata]
MFHYESESFDHIYKKLIGLLLSGESNRIASSKGNNFEVREVYIKLLNANNYNINFLDTKYPQRQEKYDKYLKDELKWYIKGCDNELYYKNTPSPKVWKKYADKSGKIVSNYGYLILREKKKFGFREKKKVMTSFEYCIKILKRKKHTKQAILHYNIPSNIWLNSKDIPCTVSSQIIIREDKLDMIIFQRSSDIYTGIIYDVPWHCELMKMFVSWFAYPPPPFQFHKMRGYWENNTYDANTAQFFSGQKSYPFDCLDHSVEITKWSEILSNKEIYGIIFPLKLILRGLLNMLSSINDYEFKNKDKALNGILDALVGMDGLIQLEEKLYKHKKVFINTWKDIVKKIGYCNHTSIMKSLYKLRCSLAHGDPDDIKSQLKNAKLSLGDKYNQSNYDSPSFGWEFGHFLIKLIELFQKEPLLLLNIYNPSKKSSCLFTNIKQIFKKKLKL